MEYLKVYIAVVVRVDERGHLKPISIFFEGKEYPVDKLVSVRMTPPEHVGGLITKRYDCLIAGKTRSLFREVTGRWFVEVQRI